MVPANPANLMNGHDVLRDKAFHSSSSWGRRLRIRVRAREAVIVREGSGAGESNAATPGQAHEFAAKAAETDATKRALMTFGNAFGLSLYGGSTDPKGKVAASDPYEKSGREAQGAPNNKPNEPSVEPARPAPANDAGDSAVAPTFNATPDAPQHVLPVTLPGPDWPQIRPLDEAERLNRERVDKSALALSEPRRVRNLGHLAFVASRPCLICGRNRAHAHHLKFAQPTALGRKVSDEFTVPLCSVHHRELHRHGDERVWWSAQGIDALQVAEELWRSRRAAEPTSPSQGDSSPAA